MACRDGCAPCSWCGTVKPADYWCYYCGAISGLIPAEEDAARIAERKRRQEAHVVTGETFGECRCDETSEVI